MARWSFHKDSFRNAFAFAKIVKPQSDEYAMRLDGKKLTIYGADKRRFIRVSVMSEGSKQEPDPDFASGEFYIAADRQALLDSDMDTIELSLTEKQVSIQATSAGQSRKASLKRRTLNSRVPLMAELPPMECAGTLRAKHFRDLLQQVSCSAQIRQTKSDEDMKINQVHFYASEQSAQSYARFYGSCVKMAGLCLDLSVVSSDIPAMKSFCARQGEDGEVKLWQDKSRLYVTNEDSSAVLAFSRVSSNKPKYSVLSPDGYSTSVVVDRERFQSALKWASMVIEGTQRLSIHTVKDEDGTDVFLMKNGADEVSKLPVKLETGSGIQADFPVKYLAGIMPYLEGDEILLKYGHRDQSTTLELSDPSTKDSVVRARHFLQSMVSREK